MIALLGFALLSITLTGGYRWLALHKHWLDHPNQRSSHTIVTPRGAGIVFALLMTAAAAWLLRYRYALALPLLAGLIVMLTGWWDDIRGTAPKARFLLYITAAALAVALTGIMDLDATRRELAVSAPCAIVAVVGLTWLINLYNFMDGINGLAVLEAIFVLLGIHLIGFDTPYVQTFSQLHLFSCAALAGFAIWNFPAGKVFMGDAGSAFLGFFLGTLMLLSLTLQGPPIAVWLILLAVFIVDTGWVLLVRIATGQKWYEAHRSHAYQKLTIRLRGNHARSTGMVMAVNMGWLLPLAWLVQKAVLSQVQGLALACLPLAAACYWLRAGFPHRAGV